MCEFRWIPWNLAKCEKHGVKPADVGYVVRRSRRPYPMRIDNDKRLAWGRTEDGDYLQVIDVLDDDYTIFVIHAMHMTDRQQRQYRRRQR